VSLQPLHQKYRPLRFKDTFQPHIVKALSNAIEFKRVPPLTIFEGGSGGGKTSMARIYSMAMNCLKKDGIEPCLSCPSCKKILNRTPDSDVIEINSSEKTGKQDVETEIKDIINLFPMFGEYRVFILDESHKLSSSAQNSLLKVLEEPPEHVRFIMCTTEVDSLIGTILNRAHKFKFKKCELGLLISNLEEICVNEGWEYEPEALEMIAISADGSPRDSVTKLDQICADKITAKDVEEIIGITNRGLSLDILENVVNSKLKDIMQIIDAVNSEGKDIQIILKYMSNNFRDIQKIKCGVEVDVSPETFNRLKEIEEKLSKGQIYRGSKVILELFNTINYRNVSQDLVLSTGLIELNSIINS